MQPYIPVSCQLHSELELMIMHEKTLQLKLRTYQETTESLVAKPYNILTKDKIEFLQLKDTYRLSKNLVKIQLFTNCSNM